MFLILAYVLFYGFIILTITLAVFSVYGIAKTAGRNCKTAKTKETWRIFSICAGIFVIMILGISSLILIRCYSLPVATGNYADSVTIKGVTYDYCNEEYPFGKSLRAVGREEVKGNFLTPEWAVNTLFVMIYFENPQNHEYIYYPGLMDWLVYKKR